METFGTETFIAESIFGRKNLNFCIPSLPHKNMWCCANGQTGQMVKLKIVVFILSSSGKMVKLFMREGGNAEI